MALSSKPTGAAVAAVDRWEGQTDGLSDSDARPLHRPCSAYYAGNVNNYPRESFREGLCNHRRWFVCLSVCLSVCLLPR